MVIEVGFIPCLMYINGFINLINNNNYLVLQICADGFFRKTNPQGDFVCIPCQCNGHSDTCDRETGVCSVSLHNPTQSY